MVYIGFRVWGLYRVHIKVKRLGFRVYIEGLEWVLFKQSLTVSIFDSL